MILNSHVRSGSHESGGVFVAAAHWLQDVMLGPIAVSIAVIAIAGIGMMMLSGRLNVRRGATVLLGCFIVFGAPAIAAGLHGESNLPRGGTVRPSEHVPDVAPPLSLPNEIPAAVSDPYAGAAVRR